MQTDQVTGTEYPVLPGDINDFTVRGEVNKPLWKSSIKELVGEGLFQSPIVSGVYERGYRQNFVTIGFPGRNNTIQIPSIVNLYYLHVCSSLNDLRHR